MNKHEKNEIKNVLSSQIDMLTKQTSDIDPDPAHLLRLELLCSAMNRIDAENFGECFICDSPIAIDLLRTSPEKKLCSKCSGYSPET
ncbi:hypothetical protein [Desulfosediminicola flagellatus]|uniref:hypothetical protein n=1 Tax=Desulfosediminicola flagellatus TaxID=2569541 RepID=UPI0010AB7AF2|nr:hypothetical protein [Desulfosediminicola flagellatus]